LYQCDGCTCFCAISSAMFGSVLDNATLISWIVSNRIQGCGRCFVVPRKLSCGPQKDRGPQFENHCCNLLFSHESMLQIHHCKSTIWSSTCAKMWITVNVQDTLKYRWKSYSIFNLGQLSHQLLQPPVCSNTDVGETQTRYQSMATLNGLNQY